MKAIVKQIDFEIKAFDLRKKDITSVFIGGGTPSTVSPKLYEDFFQKIYQYLSDDVEITTEANPNSASLDWIKGMKNLGINRISFGVQSFDDKKLKYLGRNHTSKSALKAIENAYISDIKNISLDLIHDTVLDERKLLQNDIEIASKLPVNHISSYSLTIEKDTKFFDIKEQAKEDTDTQKWFYGLIENAGFPRYEVSNFGSYVCRHNAGYWKHRDYIGIGAGAVGYKKDTRYYPPKDIQKYIQNPLQRKKEILNTKQIKEEKVFLGLRSFVGFYKDILTDKEKSRVDILKRENKVIQKGSMIFNTDYLLSDEIALFILD
jgi:oxygen-independent coproporphyrinogen-3 oxidase